MALLGSVDGTTGTLGEAMAGVTAISVKAMIHAAGREDEARLLAHVGLEPDAPPAGFVDEDAYFDVLETIMSDRHDGWHFRYAAAVDLDSYGAMGLAFKTAVDLRHSLDRAARYSALIGEGIHYELQQRERGDAAFVLVNRPVRRPGMQLSNEAGLASFVTVCRQVAATDAVLSPTSISFSHRQPSWRSAAEAFFGCPVRYAAETDAIHVDAAFLDTPTRLGDEALSTFLSAQVDAELNTVLAERGLEPRVRHVIANGLADGTPPMRVVARRLGMSERTLHRRLSEDGLRYQDLVVDVRRSVATALLTTTDRSLVDVAFLTGFADQSAFQRAFKRWTGRTPLAVRRG